MFDGDGWPSGVEFLEFVDEVEEIVGCPSDALAGSVIHEDGPRVEVIVGFGLEGEFVSSSERIDYSIGSLAVSDPAREEQGRELSVEGSWGWEDFDAIGCSDPFAAREDFEGIGFDVEVELFEEVCVVGPVSRHETVGEDREERRGLVVDVKVGEAGEGEEPDLAFSDLEVDEPVQERTVDDLLGQQADGHDVSIWPSPSDE